MSLISAFIKRQNKLFKSLSRFILNLKLKMCEKTKCVKSSNSRSKFTTMCFPCCVPKKNNKNPSYDDQIFEKYDKDEPYEYVVEKLAIKKVPLRLIALDEDLDDMSKSWSNNSNTKASSDSSCSCEPEEETEMETAMEAGDSVKDRESAVSFASYYAVVPKSDISKRTAPPQKMSSLISLHQTDIKPSMKKTHNEGRLKKEVTINGKEIEMVSHILNQCSSIYTLDPKEPIPKDPKPLNPPKRKQKLIIPPSVKKRLGANTSQTVVQAHIHQEDPLVLQTVFYPTKETPHHNLNVCKELPPDLKETIDALGVLKPQTPGFLRKNTRPRISNVKSDQEEEELCCNFLEIETKNDESNQNIHAHTYQHTCTKPCICIEEAPETSSFNSSIEDKVENNIKQISEPDILEIEHTNVSSVGENTGVYSSSHEFAEITQTKGQNLKWKIIIKHHTGIGTEKNEQNENVLPKQ